MNLKLISKGNKQHRLTITSNGNRLKLKDSKLNEIRRVIKFAEKVVTEVHPFLTYSLRGRISEHNGVFSVGLQRDNKETIFIINENSETIKTTNYENYIKGSN